MVLRSLHLVKDVAIAANCLSRLAPVRARMLEISYYALVGRLFCAPTQSLTPQNGYSMYNREPTPEPSL